MYMYIDTHTHIHDLYGTIWTYIGISNGTMIPHNNNDDNMYVCIYVCIYIYIRRKYIGVHIPEFARITRGNKLQL